MAQFCMGSPAQSSAASLAATDILVCMRGLLMYTTVLADSGPCPQPSHVPLCCVVCPARCESRLAICANLFVNLLDASDMHTKVKVACNTVEAAFSSVRVIGSLSTLRKPLSSVKVEGCSGDGAEKMKPVGHSAKAGRQVISV